MIYTRKWTKMHWWYSLKYFREAELLPHTKMNEILYQCQPPSRPAFGNYSRLNDFEPDSYPRLLSKVLEKYPELRFVPGPKISSTAEMLPNSTHVLWDFVKKQKQLIKKGFTEEKAFEMVEQQYQSRMQRKKEDFLLTEGVAVNNKARSLMNFYQQQSEYESRLKVLRLERDLLKYKTALQSFQQRVLEKSQIKDDGEENLLKEIELEEKTIENKPYKRILEKIMYKGRDIKKEKEAAPNMDPYQASKENIKNFLEGSKNVFGLYFDLVSMQDRLSGLKDDEILDMLNESPTKFKKRSKALRKKLEKLNITLDHRGNLDFTQSSAPENIKKKFSSGKLNLAAKSALMGEEIDYGFPHHEHRREKARELKNRLDILEKDEAKKMEEERERMLALSFETRKHESYEPLDEKQNEVKDTAHERSLNFKTSDFIKPESSFKLFESPEEKYFRLEKNFLISKLKDLETTSTSKEEKASYMKRLKDAIDDFRRTKFMIEKEANLKAGKMLFAEHENLDLPPNILPVYYEELELYLTQKFDQNLMTKRDLVDNSVIIKMLEKKEWDEETFNGFDFASEYKKFLTYRDTKDYYLKKEQALEKQAREMEKENLKSENEIKEPKKKKADEIDLDEELQPEYDAEYKAKKEVEESSEEDSEENLEKKKKLQNTLDSYKLAEGKDSLEIDDLRSENDLEIQKMLEKDLDETIGSKKKFEEDIKKRIRYEEEKIMKENDIYTKKEKTGIEKKDSRKRIASEKSTKNKK